MNRFEEAIKAQVAKRRKGLVVEEGVHTIGEFIRAVLGITNEKDAKEFYEGYLVYLASLPTEDNPRGFTAEKIACSNIGWCFGEGMKPEYIKMWGGVCEASHPLFGNTMPSPQKAFDIGQSRGIGS